MKRALVLVVAAGALAAGVVAAGPASPASAWASGPAWRPLYPDLVTQVPHDLRIDTSGGGRRLFFSNTIGNIGAGPLELRPENDVADGTTDAVQELYSDRPSGNSLRYLSESVVGTFVFHPAHDHWHMVDFARYELRVVNHDGSTGPVVASTAKVSFCMLDTDTIDSSLPRFGMGLGHSCGQSARQGLQVGMGDTYSSALPDQFINVDQVADGTYRLVSTADPNLASTHGHLLELDDSNNAASIDLQIHGAEMAVVEGSGRTGIDAPSMVAAPGVSAARTRRAGAPVPASLPLDPAYCQLLAAAA